MFITQATMVPLTIDGYGVLILPPKLPDPDENDPACCILEDVSVYCSLGLCHFTRFTGSRFRQPLVSEETERRDPRKGPSRSRSSNPLTDSIAMSLTVAAAQSLD